MANVVEVVLQKLGEALSWLKSQIEFSFTFMCEKISESLNFANCFIDNVLKISQEALTGFKTLIHEGMAKGSEYLKSLKGFASSSVEQMMNNLWLLKNNLGSLLEELWKMFDAMKSFAASVPKTATDFALSVGFKVEEFHGLIDMVIGLLELLNMIQYNPLILALIFFDVQSMYWNNVSKSVVEMKNSGYFQKWHGNEMKMVVSIYVLLGGIKG